MIKVRWFFHLLTRALAERRSRTLLVTMALALSAALATSLTGLTFGMREKLGEELRIYGANFVILPKSVPVGGAGIGFGEVAEQAYLSESEMKRILAGFEPAIAAYAVKLDGLGYLGDREVPVSGLRFEQIRKLGGGWKIEGAWPRYPSEALVGSGLAEQFKLARGDRLVISAKGRSESLKVTGIIETGGSEDKAVLMRLGKAQSLLGLPDKLSQILINARPYRMPLKTLARKLLEKTSAIEPKTIQQVAQAEASLLDKILKLLLLVTVSVVLGTGIAVGNTFGAIVLERRQEIGLLKALGSTNRFIGALFLAEGVAMSLGGAFLGLLGGALLAELFAWSAFGSWVVLPWTLAPIALGTSLAVGIIACLGPVGSAVKVDPAVTLKGL